MNTNDSKPLPLEQSDNIPIIRKPLRTNNMVILGIAIVAGLAIYYLMNRETVPSGVSNLAQL
jgi:hypothetical protein